MWDEIVMWVFLTSVFWLVVGWLLWWSWRSGMLRDLKAETDARFEVANELDELRDRHARCDRLSADYAAAMREHQAKMASRDDELAVVRGRNDELGRRFASLEATNADLTASQSLVAETESAFRAERARAEELTGRLAAVTAAHDRAEAEHHTVLTDHVRTITDLRGRMDAASATADETDALRTELESYRAAVGRANQEASGKIAALEARLTEAQQREGELTALQQRLDARDRELGEAAARAAETQTEVADLRRQLEHAHATNAASASAVRANSSTVPEQRSAPDTDPGAAAPDDLREIFGIGPKLARMLNEKGIQHFRQIATWTEADVRRFDEELAEFRGRIERDDWITSAKEQHLKKYGSPA
jgi:predicted flap endonuclease-1-like 5' DNA nuclease